MLRFCCSALVVGVVVSGSGTTVFAQPNVRYDGVQNPYLFLLREPAIYDELRLTESQQRALVSVNDRFDGPLLAMRIKPAEEASREIKRILSETQHEVQRIFHALQQQRLSQIALRLRGVECLQSDKVAEELQISEEQRQRIETLVKEAGDGLKKLHERAQAEGSREELDQDYQRLRQREKEQILAVLTSRQKSQLSALLGATFDASRLGRVAFKAPEFRGTDVWLNSPALRIADLKGEVIALHYFTFG